ncbi:MAG: class II aldolase/adducin family protein [Thermoguttaceae bacterium]|jgi:rhamnose utilization protein RhaD (predicted bifunctional aldolase and dehydrogenase)|nr:class II aldolase/adducin family protein [Thermoguttaceae bacterium]
MSPNLFQLVLMSNELGDPASDFAILGEGNTSAREDAATFWVKGSGAELRQAKEESFVRVRSAPVLEALDGPPLDDAALKRLLKSATVEGQRPPSIETFLHALCLELDGVHFVGHTHPTAAVGLLCSRRSRELFTGCLFPDQVVVLGPALAYVPYADPGLPLALATRQVLRDYLDRHQRRPKAIVMENHGVIALGGNSEETLNITHMLVKTCRVLAWSVAVGGPRFLAPEQVERIDKRPDEAVRREGLHLT